MANAVPPVQGRVGVLEDDLYRPELVTFPAGAVRRQLVGLELDDRARIGGNQPEQHPGQCRLAAAGLAYETQSLTETQVEVHPDHSLDALAAAHEGLRHAPEADDRRRRLVQGPQRHVLRRRPRQLRRLLVVVAARAPRGAHLVHRRRLGDATVLGERATVGEDAAPRGPPREPGGNPGSCLGDRGPSGGPAAARSASSPTVYGWRGS